MKNKEERKKKKGKVWKKILLIIIILLLVIGIGWFIYKSNKNGGGLSGMLATAVGHDENTRKNLPELKVLVLGISTSIDADLTDTIMVASYNPNTQKGNLISIPRDTFTGKNQSKAVASQKINALYNITGGPEKTLEAVNEITGLDIKYYVIVKTEALRKLVDAIGGVEFNVPIDMHYTDKTQNLVIDLKAGTQILDGNKAEQLVRYRHSNMDKNGNMTTYPVEYGNDDFGRMRTQRDFIVATLKQTLKLGNIFKIGELLDIANENVDTNLDFSYLKDYVPYVVEFNIENMTTAVLPGTTPDMSDTNGVSIFVYNKKETEKLIQSMFYSDVVEVEGESNTISDNTINEISSNITSTAGDVVESKKQIKIELLNGCGDKEKLARAKKLLEDAGYNVTTGTTSTISKTIITNKKDTSDEELKNIKTILGVGSISTNKISYSSVDVNIILGKDFEI